MKARSWLYDMICFYQAFLRVFGQYYESRLGRILCSVSFSTSFVVFIFYMRVKGHEAQEVLLKIMLILCPKRG